MPNGDLNWIANFIWGIADDVLRDVYVRGKYRDVILPMTVIRRLDACLESTKQDVLKMSEQLDKAGVANKDAALCQAAGPDANHAFYNDSPFTLRDLQARAKQQQLKADFEAYLDGFSPNVQEILDKFKFRNQIPTLVDADALGPLIEKFLNPDINLSPHPVRDAEGTVRLPGLDNHAMGTIFEELIRRFNEENNEEAGEHFTPRDVVKLMANLIFWPIADDIQSAAEKKIILNAVSWRVEDAPPVIKKVHKSGKTEVDPLRGLYANPDGDPGLVLEYEPDTELRDSEQVPLLEEGGIEAFFRREVLPYVPDAWIDESATKLGYEISFTRHFYKPPEMRPLEEIKADLLKLQEEGEGLLEEIVGGQKA